MATVMALGNRNKALIFHIPAAGNHVIHKVGYMTIK
ncbi:hypothetical protein BVRB_1g017880 [Beta vulgaris subsp. vulgaris]|nr:hypothetical protein BVRB_1g017880 [Beta vulgaris subsp. vulgaris]